jgi:hypothetical protein
MNYIIKLMLLCIFLLKTSKIECKNDSEIILADTGGELIIVIFVAILVVIGLSGSKKGEEILTCHY